MRAVDIIRKKRDGQSLTSAEIAAMVAGTVPGGVTDYQWAALLMAIVWRGMNAAETAALTDAMMSSGQVVDLSNIPGRKIDKHSTGGVGDKTSLIVAPVAAAAGVLVPMVSGRGLGHTGGTLDKLEAIPGFRVDLDLARYQEVLSSCGLVMIGQTSGDRARRQVSVSTPRRDGDRRIHSADRCVDHVEKTGRGHRWPGARRQDRGRSVHGDARRLAGPCRGDVRDRPEAGQGNGRSDHADGRAARAAPSETQSRSRSAWLLCGETGRRSDGSFDQARGRDGPDGGPGRDARRCA